MSRPRRPPGAFGAGCARLVAWLFDHLYLRTEVVGAEFVPGGGPAILAGNHTGLMDGPVVLGAARRGVHFIMKFSLGQGFGGLVLRAAGQVPVGPAGGREALAACLGLLGRGRLIGIFPEGTRGDGQMRQIRAGVAWLAVNSGAPVIPFACLGTRHSGEKISKFPPPGRRICVAFGPPVGLDLDSEASPRDQVAAALEQIGSALAAHVAQASRDSGIELPSDTGRKPSE